MYIYSFKFGYFSSDVYPVWDVVTLWTRRAAAPALNGLTLTFLSTANTSDQMGRHTNRTLLPPAGPPPPKDNWSPWPSCRRNGSRSPVDHLKALITSCGWNRLPEFTLWWVLDHVTSPISLSEIPSVPAVRLPHFGKSWELAVCLFLLHYYVRLYKEDEKAAETPSIRGIRSRDKRLIMYAVYQY